VRDERGRRAFEILVRENSRMLVAYLNSVVVDQAAVDDLFQETMVVAWKRLDECDLSRPFGPWLRGIASRLVMAFHRKRKTSPLVLNDVVLSHVEGQFAAITSRDADCWDDKVAALRDCIDSLSDSYRTAIDCRYFDDLTGPKLAEQLGISVEGCWKRLARGRRLLADCLTRKGVLGDSEAST
jgi:RNA polymerase sigma-70 factor